jgi:hypothetical protein
MLKKGRKVIFKYPYILEREVVGGRGGGEELSD